MNIKEIKKIYKVYGIEDYIINAYGTIDVASNLDLGNYGFSELPLKFGRVSVDFTNDEDAKWRDEIMGY